MSDLPTLHDTKLSDEEKSYLNRATKFGSMPSETVHMIILQRLTTYILGNLVGAMEQPDFKVLRVSTEDIKKAYTIVRIEIENTLVTFPGR